MGDIDFKLDKIIQIFDLVKRMSLGALPLWFSLTLPVIYIVYKKLLPASNPVQAAAPLTFMQRVRNWFALPQLDNIVIYTSLVLFVMGTITLYIDQRYRENVRNNGLRMKEYLVAENLYSLPKNNLVSGISKLKLSNIDAVLSQYPSEFIQTENNNIVLMDSVPQSKIIITSEKLLDSYMSGIKADSSVSINSLFAKRSFFIRGVVYKLITDSAFKYRYTIDSNGVQGVIRKK